MKLSYEKANNSILTATTARAVIVKKEFLEEDKPLSVTVTVNSRCPMECPVTVAFGTQPISGGTCVTQANVTSEPLSPGATANLSVEAGSVIRMSSENYCYLISLCGKQSKYIP